MLCDRGLPLRSLAVPGLEIVQQVELEMIDERSIDLVSISLSGVRRRTELVLLTRPIPYPRA